MPDGIPVGNRVDHTTERKLHAKVVDNILNRPSLSSRFMGMGQKFRGKTYDYTIKISRTNQGQFVAGMEQLNVAATDTTIQLSFAHTAYSHPVTIPFLEALANTGPEATIDLEAFKYDEAKAEGGVDIAEAIYGLGTGNRPLGLEAIVDDGTNAGTIGGQSRTTYTQLKSIVTASGGLMTLTKLGTLHDNISDAGVESEEPTLHATTKNVWTLFESLVHPQLRAEYSSVGYDKLPIRGMEMVKKGDLKGGAGFTALSYRGLPVIKDDYCPTGNWYMVNENYLTWRGRTEVPAKFKNFIRYVDLGSGSNVLEGVSAAPSKYHGWFFQDYQMSPNQGGIVGRFWVVGQLMTSQPRRHGKLTGITAA